MGGTIKVRRHLWHYWLLLRLGLKSQTIYRLDFWLWVVGIVVINVVDLLLLAVLLRSFVVLGGWTIWEIVGLYCMFLLVLGLQGFFTFHLLSLEFYIQDGTLDQMLVRPCSPLVQLLGRQINHKDVTHVALGLGGVLLACSKLGLPWTPMRALLLVVSAASGAVVLAGITLALCSLAFWTVQSREFLQGTEQLQEIVQHYPAHIFGGWFVWLISTVLPFAFVNYYPTMVLLGRAREAPVALAYGSPVAAVVVMGVAVRIWHAGLRSYQSTGS